MPETRSEASRLQGRLIILHNRARVYGHSMADRGTSPAEREIAGADWGSARTQIEKTEKELEEAKRLIEELEEKLGAETSTKDDSSAAESLEQEIGGGVFREELVRSINDAHTRLIETRKEFVAAADALTKNERRLKRENAESLLEARNERSMMLYLEGILDNPDHHKLVEEKSQAELAHYEARMEVERLELLVRLLEATAKE